MDVTTYIWELVKVVIPWALGGLTTWLGHLQLNKVSKKEFNRDMDQFQKQLKDVETRITNRVNTGESKMDAAIMRLETKIDSQSALTNDRILQMTQRMVTKEDFNGIEDRIAGRLMRSIDH